MRKITSTLLCLVLCACLFFAQSIFVFAAEKSDEQSSHIHLYKNGECIICGKDQPFYTLTFPNEIYGECPEAGKIHIDSIASSFEEGGITIDVYTPYGYDENNHYDTIILFHGSTGNRTNWMTDSFRNDPFYINGKQVFDWLIYNKECLPFIAVSVDLPNEFIYTQSAYDRMTDILELEIMPYVIKHYATYAEDIGDVRKSMESVRNHFGICGFSMGSRYAMNIGLEKMPECFNVVIPMSGVCFSYKQLESLLMSEDSYAHKLYLVTGGPKDCNYQNEYNRHLALNNLAYNHTYIQTRAGHSWVSCFLAFYRIMTDAFPRFPIQISAKDFVDPIIFEHNEKCG